MTWLAGLGIFLFALLMMRLGGEPNRENKFDKSDKMIAETKMYQIRQGRQK